LPEVGMAKRAEVLLHLAISFVV